MLEIIQPVRGCSEVKISKKSFLAYELKPVVMAKT